jgi:hypothetical protein
MISCVHLAPYTPLSRSGRNEDPDALYRATIHVFERRGWPIQMADPSAREVRSGWFPFVEMGLFAGAEAQDYAASVRVKVDAGTLRVTTGCDWMNDFDRATRSDACPDGLRPEGLHEREVELVGDILDEALDETRAERARRAREDAVR